MTNTKLHAYLALALIFKKMLFYWHTKMFKDWRSFGFINMQVAFISCINLVFVFLHDQVITKHVREFTVSLLICQNIYASVHFTNIHC